MDAINALDNLTAVCQGGTLVGTTCQNGLGRTFTYNSLSRLTGATNPESGDVTYEYDGNGNLLTKTDLRGVTTSAFDELNRIKSKGYSHSGAAATPAVAFCYDGRTYAGGACAGDRVTGKFGRLTAVGNSVSVTTFTGIDALGRVTASTQSTAGQSYLFSYGYNLAGGLTSITYPSGRVLSIGYDEAGRAKEVSGVLQGTTTHYTSGTTPIGYAAHGGVNEVVLGHGKVEQTCYNSRLQVGLIRVGAASSANCADADDLWRLENHYGTSDNNGNVEGQTLGVTVGGSRLTFQTSFEYDAVNRLKMATEGTAWSRTYGYDGRANQWVSAWSGLSPGSFTPTSSSWFDAATNRMTGAPSAQFDDGGNQTQIGGYTFGYDAENRLKESTINSVTTAYEYDGDGRRVKKVTGGATTVFVYDAFGQLAAEYGSTPPPGANTQYVATDHLGSIRMMTDGDGIISLHDYQPFGEEIPAGTGGRTSLWGAADNVAQRFTGKERDAETGLDYFRARYYGSNIGRFTSVDPVKMLPERLRDPQQLNLYAYGRNNPLRFIDPMGTTIDDSACLTNNGCKNWKEAYLKSKEGQMQWKKLDDDKKLLVKLKWDKDAAKSVTGDYKWDNNGKLTEATVTLAPRTGDVSYRMDPTSYPFGSTITDMGERKVYVVGHELAHVEDADTPDGRRSIQEVHRLYPDAKARYDAEGQTGYANDRELQATFAIICADNQRNENVADKRAQGIVESYRCQGKECK